MKIAAVITTISIVGILALLKAQSLPEGKVTLRVVDETGNPIPKAEVKAGFGLPYNGWVERPKGYGKEISTDSNGLAVLEGETTGRIGFSVRHEGYYLSRDEIYFTEKQSGKWQPWNQQADFVVKRIINPVPMYAKYILDFILPAYDSKVGYDFSVGDFTSPHGKGIQSDILFFGHLDRRGDSDYDYYMDVIFPTRGMEFKCSRRNAIKAAFSFLHTKRRKKAMLLLFT